MKINGILGKTTSVLHVVATDRDNLSFVIEDRNTNPKSVGMYIDTESALALANEIIRKFGNTEPPVKNYSGTL